MANRVKTISKYSGSAWGTEVPIGADATNVDMTTAPSDYDSSSSETSKVLIGTNDVKVIASDTDLTAWGKFNRFRRRVSNKFADYFATANVKTSYQTTGANGDVYSTSLLNSYFSNVIGYTGSSAPTAGSVASQLESLNSKIDHSNDGGPFSEWNRDTIENWLYNNKLDHSVNYNGSNKQIYVKTQNYNNTTFQANYQYTAITGINGYNIIYCGCAEYNPLRHDRFVITCNATTCFVSTTIGGTYTLTVICCYAA